jgi:hypothetical protein
MILNYAIVAALVVFRSDPEGINYLPRFAELITIVNSTKRGGKNAPEKSGCNSGCHLGSSCFNQLCPGFKKNQA